MANTLQSSFLLYDIAKLTWKKFHDIWIFLLILIQHLFHIYRHTHVISSIWGWYQHCLLDFLHLYSAYWYERGNLPVFKYSKGQILCKTAFNLHGAQVNEFSHFVDSFVMFISFTQMKLEMLDWSYFDLFKIFLTIANFLQIH